MCEIRRMAKDFVLMAASRDAKYSFGRTSVTPSAEAIV